MKDDDKDESRRQLTVYNERMAYNGVTDFI